jgi:hypothetical protein
MVRRTCRSAIEQIGEPRAMLIWLASYPRSGNTFFRALVKHVYGLSSYEVYDWGERSPSPIKDITGGTSAPLTIAEMAASDRLFLVKTHDLPGEDFPAIYLVRDGRDALVSHAHFVLEYDLRLPREPERVRETLQSLISSEHSFGGWSRNVREWTQRSTPTVVVRFEDLVARPLDELRKAVAGVGLTLPEQRTDDLPTFGHLNAQVPAFFRRGEVGSWRDEMPDDLHKLFWAHHGAMMKQLGYRKGTFGERLLGLWARTRHS